MRRDNWVVCDATTQSTRCLRCGASEPFNAPVAVTELCRRIEAFTDKHKDCKPRKEKSMRGIGYWWDVVSHWPESVFDTWLAKQSRETLVQMLQETDPNGCWTDKQATLEIGTLTSLERAREQMRIFWNESKDLGEAKEVEENDGISR